MQYMRTRGLFDGVGLLLKADLTSEALILARSLYETSLRLIELAARDDWAALVAGWSIVAGGGSGGAGGGIGGPIGTGAGDGGESTGHNGLAALGSANPATGGHGATQTAGGAAGRNAQDQELTAMAGSLGAGGNGASGGISGGGGGGGGLYGGGGGGAEFEWASGLLGGGHGGSWVCESKWPVSNIER